MSVHENKKYHFRAKILFIHNNKKAENPITLFRHTSVLRNEFRDGLLQNCHFKSVIGQLIYKSNVKYIKINMFKIDVRCFGQDYIVVILSTVYLIVRYHHTKYEVDRTVLTCLN